VAWLREELSKTSFERDLAEAKARRLTGEVQSLQSQLASLQADRTILQTRLADRERYLTAIEASLGWRIVERVRTMVGRGWK
jgi:uncharacterized protein YlxW (UPF0749 family)